MYDPTKTGFYRTDAEWEALKLENHSNKIELLEKYSLFLEEHGYMDTDWRAEEPYAIDEFLKPIIK